MTIASISFSSSTTAVLQHPGLEEKIAVATVLPPEIQLIDLMLAQSVIGLKDIPRNPHWGRSDHNIPSKHVVATVKRFREDLAKELGELPKPHYTATATVQQSWT